MRSAQRHGTIAASRPATLIASAGIEAGPGLRERPAPDVRPRAPARVDCPAHELGEVQQTRRPDSILGAHHGTSRAGIRGGPCGVSPARGWSRSVPAQHNERRKGLRPRSGNRMPHGVTAAQPWRQDLHRGRYERRRRRGRRQARRDRCRRWRSRAWRCSRAGAPESVPGAPRARWCAAGAARSAVHACAGVAIQSTVAPMAMAISTSRLRAHGPRHVAAAQRLDGAGENTRRQQRQRVGISASRPNAATPPRRTARGSTAATTTAGGCVRRARSPPPPRLAANLQAPRSSDADCAAALARGAEAVAAAACRHRLTPPTHVAIA